MSTKNPIRTEIEEVQTKIEKSVELGSRVPIANKTRVAKLVRETPTPLTRPRKLLGMNNCRASDSPIEKPYSPILENKIMTKKI